MQCSWSSGGLCGKVSRRPAQTSPDYGATHQEVALFACPDTPRGSRRQCAINNNQSPPLQNGRKAKRR